MSEMPERAAEFPPMTAEEYMAFEHHSPLKHEFVNGNIYMMVGASDRHGIIAGNIFAALHSHLPEKCDVFISDMKLRIQKQELEVFYYPDILVSCDETDRERYFREKPVLLMEVLSRSTQRIDRTEKYDAYKLIPSLEEYLIVSQAEPKVEIFRRKTDWNREVYGMDDTLELTSVDLTLDVRRLYRRVPFDG